MSEHTPRTSDETALLRLQVEASTWEHCRLTRENGVLADLVEFHREQAHELRTRLRQTEELLAAQTAPMPVGAGLEGVAA